MSRRSVFVRGAILLAVVAITAVPITARAATSASDSDTDAVAQKYIDGLNSIDSGFLDAQPNLVRTVAAASRLQALKESNLLPIVSDEVQGFVAGLKDVTVLIEPDAPDSALSADFSAATNGVPTVVARGGRFQLTSSILAGNQLARGPSSPFPICSANATATSGSGSSRNWALVLAGHCTSGSTQTWRHAYPTLATAAPHSPTMPVTFAQNMWDLGVTPNATTADASSLYLGQQASAPGTASSLIAIDGSNSSVPYGSVGNYTLFPVGSTICLSGVDAAGTFLHNCGTFAGLQPSISYVGHTLVWQMIINTGTSVACPGGTSGGIWHGIAGLGGAQNVSALGIQSAINTGGPYGNYCVASQLQAALNYYGLAAFN